MRRWPARGGGRDAEGLSRRFAEDVKGRDAEVRGTFHGAKNVALRATLAEPRNAPTVEAPGLRL